MPQEHLYSFGEKKLVMGLRWLPVVGQITLPKARLLARHHNAKQWVISGQTFFAVGLSHRRKTVHKNGYAAAVCYAFLYPKGWHATIYKLNSDLYWLAAVHEGTPITRGDKLFTDLTQAQAALSQLMVQQPMIQADLNAIAIADFLALISTHPLQKAFLQSIRTNRWLPLCAVVLLVGLWGWWQFKPAPVEAAIVVPEVDPYLSSWESTKINLNGKDAIVQLLVSFGEIPLMLKGWQLQEVSCDAKAQQWLCIYEYKATAEAATTLELEQVFPDGWENKEINLQRAWFQSMVYFINHTPRWLNAEQVRLQLLSQLQTIRPAFSNLRLTEPTLLVPRLARVSTYSPIFTQELYFEGPLRSLALLTDFDEAVEWQRVVLQYKPQAEASLNGSALQVKLKGVVYVRD